LSPPLSPPLFGAGSSDSWPTAVASWTRDFPLLLPCSWELHPPEPRPEALEPEEREPPELEELEPEEREPPEEEELEPEDEPPDLPKRASATVVVKKHPAASAAHSVCLGSGRGSLLGMRLRAFPSKHFCHPSGRHSPGGDACPTA
jgi:hypothetical protein